MSCHCMFCPFEMSSVVVNHLFPFSTHKSHSEDVYSVQFEDDSPTYLIWPQSKHRFFSIVWLPRRHRLGNVETKFQVRTPMAKVSGREMDCIAFFGRLLRTMYIRTKVQDRQFKRLIIAKNAILRMPTRSFWNKMSTRYCWSTWWNNNLNQARRCYSCLKYVAMGYALVSSTRIQLLPHSRLVTFSTGWAFHDEIFTTMDYKYIN